MRAYKKKRRQQLYLLQNGKCFWCGRHMRQFETSGGKLPADACTLDHLRDRFNPTRQAPSRGEVRLVAACFKCNSRRGRESCIAAQAARA